MLQLFPLSCESSVVLFPLSTGCCRCQPLGNQDHYAEYRYEPSSDSSESENDEKSEKAQCSTNHEECCKQLREQGCVVATFNTTPTGFSCPNSRPRGLYLSLKLEKFADMLRKGGHLVPTGLGLENYADERMAAVVATAKAYANIMEVKDMEDFLFEVRDPQAKWSGTLRDVIALVHQNNKRNWRSSRKDKPPQWHVHHRKIFESVRMRFNPDVNDIRYADNAEYQITPNRGKSIIHFFDGQHPLDFPEDFTQGEEAIDLSINHTMCLSCVPRGSSASTQLFTNG
jgi:hypothetical protein